MSSTETTVNQIHHDDCVIANGSQESGGVFIKGATLSGVYIPAVFTGTAISFLASHDGQNFSPVMDGQGNEISRTVSAGQYIALDPTTFAGINHLKIKSGTAEAASRTMKIASRVV